MEKNQKYILGIIIIAAIIIAVGFYMNTSGSGKKDDNVATSTVSINSEALDIFAKCTAEKGLAMYGAAWCSHCTAQKKLFGESFKYVNYVECPDNIKLCTDKGINGYPTWMDSAGKKYEGEQSFATIAQITGCELPK
jgi:hypothetical protein